MKKQTLTSSGTSFNFKKVWNKIMNQLQRLGKSLMFPIAVLPIAALLLRIGVLISDPQGNGSIGIAEAQILAGKIISTPGDIVFSNLALIFAIGVGFGLTKDFRGEAALVGAVVWLGMTALLKENGLATIIYSSVLTSETLASPNAAGQLVNRSQLLYFLKGGNVTYFLDTGVVGGIICGGMTAFLYNRYKNIKLPAALSFFGGRRFIPMLGIVAIVPLALVFAIFWPWFQFVLIKMGQGLSNAEGFGKGAAAGVYAFLNRILQPFGLHHIINTFVWFQLPIEGVTITDAANNISTNTVVNGDIPAFTKGILGSGVFTTGFFPLFLGGLPGAALAMILTSNRDKRRQMALFYGGALIVSFLTGIDEPLVFAFVFISPVLYVSNAILTGIFYMFVTWTKASIGFGFSAGLIDYIVSFPLAWNMSKYNGVMANPLWIWAFAAAMFATYFGWFYFIIKKMNVMIPGREATVATEQDDGVVAQLHPDGTATVHAVAPKKLSADERYQQMAKDIVAIIGVDKIEIVENCATRLRLTVANNDKSQIDDRKIVAAGARGVVRVGDKGYQIIIGTDVEHVADIVRKLTNK